MSFDNSSLAALAQAAPPAHPPAMQEQDLGLTCTEFWVPLRNGGKQPQLMLGLDIFLCCPGAWGE